MSTVTPKLLLKDELAERFDPSQYEFFDQGLLDTWASMMDEQEEAFRDHIQFILTNKQLEPDGRYSVLTAAGMKPEALLDINKLKHLKCLDL